MGRTEYFNDPDAPAANSIVVAAAAFVQDDQSRVLLVQRSDNGLWAPPGGGQDVGEYVAQTAERETFEETGYRISVVDIVGVYSDPHHIMAYGDGEVRQQFALLFRGRLDGGDLATSPESPRVAWVPPNEIAHLTMHPSIRLRVEHGLASRGKPYIG